MRDQIKSYIKNSPYLLKYARILTDKTLWGFSYKKRIRGKSNRVKIKKTALLNKCHFKISGNNNTIEIGGGSILRNVTFFIKGDGNKINLSDFVQFNRDGLLWIEDDDCRIDIGKESTFEGTHLAATENGSKIQIGEDCMFAYDIDVRTGDSHSIIDSETGKRINFAKDVKIGDHVWVGSHVSILKGVEIKKNSIVATRSVVTKSFDESNVIIGGGPAKILKKRVNWDRRRLAKNNDQ